MEFNSTIVGFIILLIIFGPVGYLIVKSSGKDGKAKKKLVKLAEDKGIKPSKIEIIGNLVIGLDVTNKKLVLSNKNNLTDNFRVVDITTLSGMRTKTIGTKNNNLDWVGLELSNHTLKQEVEFYNEDDDSCPGIDAFATEQDAKRWENLISPLIA